MGIETPKALPKAAADSRAIGEGLLGPYALDRRVWVRGTWYLYRRMALS